MLVLFVSDLYIRLLHTVATAATCLKYLTKIEVLWRYKSSVAPGL